jgi:hypothetical protein
MFEGDPLGNNQGSRSRSRIPHPDGIDVSKPPSEVAISDGGFASSGGLPVLPGARRRATGRYPATAAPNPETGGYLDPHRDQFP